MASRRAEKEAARQKRLEAERAAAAGRQRTQRLQILGGVVVVAVVAVVVVVLVAGGGGSKKAVTNPTSPKAKSTAATVDRLLDGIPQSGMTLGNPKAPVTLTEFGDLECPYCAEFALGTENQVISGEVRTGKVKLVYKSFETATGGGPNASNWSLQQAGAYAAGKQNRAWHYIELFYHEQGQEDSGYATDSFFETIAKQVPGLDFTRWNSERHSSALAQQVTIDGNEGTAIGVNATPTLVAAGPKSQTKPVSSASISYGQVQKMVESVS